MGYTKSGRNWFGQRGSYLPTTAVKDMVRDPYLLALISWLQAENAPGSTFWVADGLADKLGWPRRQLATARRQAIAAGWIVPLSAPSPGRAISRSFPLSTCATHCSSLIRSSWMGVLLGTGDAQEVEGFFLDV